MKVLITANFTPEGIRELEELGIEVIYEPWTRRNRVLLSDELAERIVATGAKAVILESDLCHGEVFEAAKLKFIGCCRCDPLVVDLDCANASRTPVFFTPGRNAEAVADLTVALMIDLLRQVIPAANAVRSGDFNPETPADYIEALQRFSGPELGSRVVGIIGLGSVGSAVARRLLAFGSALLVHDPFAPDERLRAFNARRVGLSELFRLSDLVTLHAAEREENGGMITADLIGAMKPSAYFLNLARASLVDNGALYRALADYRIAGAALDVFSREPVSTDDPLVKLPNVIALPHLGGASPDVVRHQSEMIVASVRSWLKGKKPRHCVNPEVI